MNLSPFPTIDVCFGVSVSVLVGRVHLDVPVEEERGGREHDALIIHELPRLPLPGGKLLKSLIVALHDDIDDVLEDVLGEMFEMAADGVAKGVVGGRLAGDGVQQDLISHGSEETVS